jgi:cytosine/adenosine deaminase-related metal-dependent hydrolase
LPCGTPVLYLARYLLPVTSPPVEDGAVLVEGGRILAIGTRRELQRGWTGKVVDFGDAVILPPLTNAHTHLELTRFPHWAAEIGEPADAEAFVDWILRLIRIKRRQDGDELRRSLEEGLQASLAAGTGAIGDILSCLEIFPVYRTSPLYGRFFLEVLGVDSGQVRSRLENLETAFQSGPAGFLEPGLAPHAPYTLSAAAMTQILSVATNRPLSMHFAESVEESEFLDLSTGALAEKLYPAVGWEGKVPPPGRTRSTRWLEALGLLAYKPLLVHGVQVTCDDAELLAKRGVTVVLCPRSNARLQVGRAPVEHYRAAGVPLALGTDSLASCPSLSIWDELAFADRLFSDRLNPGEMLAMATVNGARALGLEGEMGSLEAGWGAHFQVLEFDSPPELSNMEAFLCSRGENPDRQRLFLKGRQVGAAAGPA